MNHSSRPNLEMRVPRSGYRVAWYALCDIWQGTELVFKYGGDTEEYDALDNVDSSGRIVYPRRQRRRLL
jgi:SET domain-containing protein